MRGSRSAICQRNLRNCVCWRATLAAKIGWRTHAQHLIEAFALADAAGDPIDLANTLAALEQIERDFGHNDVALQHYEEAVELYRSTEDIQKQAHTIRHLADIYRHERQNNEAAAHYREALDLYRADVQTAPLDLANAIRGFKILRQDAGQREEAKQLWREVRELYAAVNVEAGVRESTRRDLWAESV